MHSYVRPWPLRASFFLDQVGCYSSHCQIFQYFSHCVPEYLSHDREECNMQRCILSGTDVCWCSDNSYPRHLKNSRVLTELFAMKKQEKSVYSPTCPPAHAAHGRSETHGILEVLFQHGPVTSLWLNWQIKNTAHYHSELLPNVSQTRHLVHKQQHPRIV